MAEFKIVPKYDDWSEMFYVVYKKGLFGLWQKQFRTYSLEKAKRNIEELAKGDIYVKLPETPTLPKV